MSFRKKHHFVPQFYLRQFAVDDEGKRVALYHHQKDMFIPKAPIKHQACENLLYGVDDEIEEALSKIENVTALIFRHILATQTPPPEKSPYYKIVKEFVLYQLSRTTKAGDNYNKFISAMYKEVFKKTSHYKEKYENIEFYHQQPTLLSLFTAAKTLPMMEYLSCKLLLNQTTVPFITSDAPAIKYNQFLENKKIKQGTTGIATKGLQIFFPLSPWNMLVFYDPLVYKLKNRNDQTIITSELEDIRQLNILQYICCNRNLFCNNGISHDYLQSIKNRFETLRLKSGPITNTVSSSVLESGEESVMLMTTSNKLQINLDLSFIKLTKTAKHYDLGNSLVHLRHPNLKAIHQNERY